MEEIEVASILFELPHIIFESESRSRFPFTWGAKRRRSACGDTPSLDRVRLLLSSSSLPSVLEIFLDAEEGPTNKVGAASPATPLSFSPSESDEKRNNLRRKSTLKMKREEWLKIIDELTRRKELLKGEVETVKRYYGKQVAINLRLKARKQELINLGLKHKEEPHLVTGKKLNLEIEELAQPTAKSLVSVENLGHQCEPIMVDQQPFLIDQTARNSEITDYPYGHTLSLLPPSSEVGRVNDNVGSLGIPDLNVSPDEAFSVDSLQPYDLIMLNKSMSKVIAAQARQRRIQICRFKNSNASIKLRCSSR